MGYGDEWLCTVYVFPRKDVPPDIADPIKQKMIDKAQKEDLFTKHTHVWICGHQSNKTRKRTRLIRLIFDDSPIDLDVADAD